MGRKAKPTSVKKMAGNPGKRKLPKDEPLPEKVTAAAVTEAPEWWPEEAKREWRRVTPQLTKLGLLTLIDFAALEGYCLSYARAIEAEIKLSAEGLTIESHSEKQTATVMSITTTIKKNPAATVAHEAWARVRAFASEFGLTPASRPKLTGAIVGKPDSPATSKILAFLAKKK